MLIKNKLLFLTVLLITSQIVNSANLLDFCDYRNKLVESEVGLEIIILKSRISSDTFGEFVSNKTIQTHFQNVFNETISNHHIHWDTKIDEMYMVSLNKFVPKTLGCIYRPDYHIKSLSNRTTIDIGGLMKVISNEVYEEMQRIETINPLPVIVLQGSSIREAVFCVFGSLFRKKAYFFVECLFEPSIGLEIPKFIKITEQSLFGEKVSNDGVLCFSHYPKYCGRHDKKHPTENKTKPNEIQARAAITAVNNNKTADEDSSARQTFNVSNVPDNFKQFFKYFYCSNCTVNIQVKN